MSSASKKLLLLVNLGSPKQPNRKEVGTFLREFLMDPFVIDIPAPLRWCLVNLIIAPIRSSRSAKAYQKIWLEKEGSPLVYNTEKLNQALGQELKDITVDFAMRYNGPSIEEVIRKHENCSEVFVLPLYPQYAESSNRTVLVEVEKLKSKFQNQKKLFGLDFFYNEPEYINTLSNFIENQIQNRPIDHILFSYHGLPERHMTKLGPDYKLKCLASENCCPSRFGTKHNCYRSHCFETTSLVVNQLKSQVSTSTSFQSRLGRDEWIKPYTTVHIEDLVLKKKIKNLAVVCPSFVGDCLETLEEVEMELKHQFEELGGENFYYIPALNDDASWIKALSEMFTRTSSNWPSIF